MSDHTHELLFTISFHQQRCNSYRLGGHGVKIRTRWIETFSCKRIF